MAAYIDPVDYGAVPNDTSKRLDNHNALTSAQAEAQALGLPLRFGPGTWYIDSGTLWSAKTKLVVTRPPSPGDIHGVIRRARPSSRYRNRLATCVCGRWLEFGPGWIPELQAPVMSAAGLGCNGFSTLRRLFSSGAR
jgi:hypothetical protein